MVEMSDVLYEVNVFSVMLRVCLAMLLGGILGIERGRKHRPAGFRTYMLVCLGTTIVMLTNQYVFERYGGGDPVRMGAQVISGIGFLGAGTIIVTGRNQVKGLTTAAGLWAAACVGLAVGIGFYEGAVIGGVAVVLILTFFHRLDVIILNKSRRMEIYLEAKNAKELAKFIKIVKQQRLEIGDVFLESLEHQEDGRVGAVMIIKWKGKFCNEDIISKLQDLPEICHLEVI